MLFALNIIFILFLNSSRVSAIQQLIYVLVYRCQSFKLVFLTCISDLLKFHRNWLDFEADTILLGVEVII